MHQPRPAQFFNREPYWDAVEQMRTPKGLPPWTFDFISVHPGHDGYSLISPMCLVEPKRGERPVFEGFKFPTKQNAVEAAKSIAKGRSEQTHKIFIVYCPDNTENTTCERRR